MRVLSAILLSLRPITEGRFLHKISKESVYSKKRPLRSNYSYGTGGEACCACYQSRKKNPENSGFAATFQAQKCETCYVADIHGITAQEESVKGISLGVQSQDSFSAISGATGAVFIFDVGNLSVCKAKCAENVDCGAYGYWQRSNECHIVTPNSATAADWRSQESNPFQAAYPGIKYFQKGGSQRASGKADYNIVETSARAAVSEWFWSCVEGVPPAPGQAWSSANKGDPPNRDSYFLCSEDEYYCPGGLTGEDIIVGVVIPAGGEAHAPPGDSVDPYIAEGLYPKISKPWKIYP